MPNEHPGNSYLLSCFHHNNNLQSNNKILFTIIIKLLEQPFSVTYNERQIIDLIVLLCVFTRRQSVRKRRWMLHTKHRQTLLIHQENSRCRKLHLTKKLMPGKQKQNCLMNYRYIVKPSFCVRQRRIVWNKISGGSFSFYDGDGSEHITLFNF